MKHFCVDSIKRKIRRKIRTEWFSYIGSIGTSLTFWQLRFNIFNDFLFFSEFRQIPSNRTAYLLRYPDAFQVIVDCNIGVCFDRIFTALDFYLIKHSLRWPGRRIGETRQCYFFARDLLILDLRIRLALF